MSEYVVNILPSRYIRKEWFESYVSWLHARDWVLPLFWHFLYDSTFLHFSKPRDQARKITATSLLHSFHLRIRSLQCARRNLAGSRRPFIHQDWLTAELSEPRLGAESASIAFGICFPRAHKLASSCHCNFANLSSMSMSTASCSLAGGFTRSSKSSYIFSEPLRICPATRGTNL